MRRAIAALALLPLAACGEVTPEQAARLREALPATCRVIDIGTYGNIDDLVIVRCDNRPTTSAFHTVCVRRGKTCIPHEFAEVTIE